MVVPVKELTAAQAAAAVQAPESVNALTTDGIRAIFTELLAAQNTQN